MSQWTDSEIAILRANYKLKTHAEIVAMLPGRTENAIRTKCWRLDLEKQPRWTAPEIERLREVYKRAGPTDPVNLRWLEIAFGRHRTNICAKARQLGLNTTYGRQSGEWFRNEASEWISRGYRLRGVPERKWTHVKGGKREDLGGMYFRSAWEANYARWLNFLVAQGEISKWEYEAERFEFEGIKRGHRSFTPDFKVTNCDGAIEYHEVKGWMDPASKTKLKRMAKYHPKVTIILIEKDAYHAIAKECKNLIANWE